MIPEDMHPFAWCEASGHVWVNMRRTEDLCFIGGWCLFCGTCLILFDGIIDEEMTYVGPEVSLALSIIKVD